MATKLTFKTEFKLLKTSYIMFKDIIFKEVIDVALKKKDSVDFHK